MIVNVDISSALFYKSGPLVELCMEFLGVRGNAGQYLTSAMDRRRKNDLLKFIRNLNVETLDHEGHTRRRGIKAFSDQGADQEKFDLDGRQVTVAVSNVSDHDPPP